MYKTHSSALCNTLSCSLNHPYVQTSS